MFKSKKYLLIPLFLLLIALLCVLLNKKPDIESKFVQNVSETTSDFENESEKQTEIDNKENNALDLSENTTDTEIKPTLPQTFLENKFHVYQTFNNCGPATLSMALKWYGINAPQEELADKMRPYQHPEGDNDDKTIFTYEFVDWAKEYGVGAVGRVNGDINLIKKFISNGFPVVVKTWLKKGEDIGHFRFVTGYDENKQLIYFDDSYDGPNRKMGYYDFLSLWQPFNYAYIVLYENSSEDLIKEIIGQDWEEKIAYKNSLIRAEKENEKDPDNIYPIFNISTSAFHLGDYKKSVESFEKVQDRLTKRMLWYQIEPIKAYLELKNYDKVFEIIGNILENGNRAFSELYMIRGDIYIEQGLKEKAKEQFELALKYNTNMESAEEALNSLE